MSAPETAQSTTLVAARLFASPLGPLRLKASSAGIRAVSFTGDAPATEASPEALGHIERLARELTMYFAGTLTAFTAPLDLQGTEFQLTVWRRLLQIPFGKTCSYLDVARAIGNPEAVRAVGLANGCNPIAIVVPCHRVIGSNGKLVGYGGELWRKQWLLNHERRRATGEMGLFTVERPSVEVRGGSPGSAAVS